MLYLLFLKHSSLTYNSFLLDILTNLPKDLHKINLNTFYKPLLAECLAPWVRRPSLDLDLPPGGVLAPPLSAPTPRWWPPYTVPPPAPGYTGPCKAMKHDQCFRHWIFISYRQYWVLIYNSLKQDLILTIVPLASWTDPTGAPGINPTGAPCCWVNTGW